MFRYDSALVAAADPTPQSIADVLVTMNRIDSICVDGDGLKWFDGLYLLEPYFADGYNGSPPNYVVGAGMRFNVADLDGDGRADIIVALSLKD